MEILIIGVLAALVILFVVFPLFVVVDEAVDEYILRNKEK